MAIAKASVHFHSGDEVLATKSAPLWRSFESEGMAGPENVAEFPRLIGEIFRGNGVLCEVPAFNGAGQNQFQLQFVIVFLARKRVGNEKIGLHIMAFDFFEKLVGAVFILILEIEDGIDEVLAFQRSHAVFPAEAGEYRGVVESGLAVEIELSG